ncbi:MAG TPA: tetratricopeptide repeat protein, partial [Pyrinomonadaceae bacterium]|nr:tetratricopeptide repeat protein [Pyrinomonadaceae bacterium]
APGNAPLNSLLGEHFYGANRRALARDYLERALNAERDPRTALLLGLLLADEGESERARGLLNEVVGGGLQSFAAHYALGRLHFAEGDPRVALAEFQRALRAWPGAEANYVVGAVSYLVGRRRAAARYLAKAVELDPSYAEAHYALGVVHLSFEERERATEAFDAALAADKNEPRYREARRLARRGRRLPELLPFGPEARSRRRLLTGGDPRLALVLQQDALAGTLAR